MSKILDTLEPSFRPKVAALITKAKEHGIILVPTSGRRTMAEQNKLYAQGRTTKGEVVTKAKGGQSAHNFGLACDLCPLDKNGDLWWVAPDDVWHVISVLAKEVGLEPGYAWVGFQDSPHVQDPKWKDAQFAWKSGKLQVA